MTALVRVGRYWHTLRHLKPVQFYGRLWFRLHRPRPSLAPAPRVRQAPGGWVAPARREASMTTAQDFLFLGCSGSLADVGWDGPQREKLWRYNQHYFDDLNALQSAARSPWHHALLADWVVRNPPGVGNGWEPYPTSLRIVNWVKWSLAGHTLPPACVHSLAVQARWLRQRLETHLLGNHLFANAKALVFAGLFFEGPQAQRWLEHGLGILERQLPEQVLADGGHFERSTMYHALALEDVLDLCNLLTAHAAVLTDAQRRLTREWSKRAAAMLAWMQAMRHPDGEIAFFNDAALGVAPGGTELGDYADRLGLGAAADTGSRQLAASGYVRLQAGAAVALLDLAPVGPDYLPGHAHADTLSFELSVHGGRVLVNSGTSCYGSSPERLRQRGTAAHNTVVIDGEDSSEVWSGFRVARRARPVAPSVSLDDPDTPSASCAHDGYARLPGSPLHSRQWWLSDHGLRVVDQVQGPRLRAQARYHFHPALVVSPGEDGQRGELRLPQGQVVRWLARGGAARVEASSWHPRFGISVPSLCLVLDLADGHAELQLSWTR